MVAWTRWGFILARPVWLVQRVDRYYGVQRLPTGHNYYWWLNQSGQAGIRTGQRAVWVLPIRWLCQSICSTPMPEPASPFAFLLFHEYHSTETRQCRCGNSPGPAGKYRPNFKLLIRYFYDQCQIYIWAYQWLRLSMWNVSGVDLDFHCSLRWWERVSSAEITKKVRLTIHWWNFVSVSSIIVRPRRSHESRSAGECSLTLDDWHSCVSQLVNWCLSALLAQAGYIVPWLTAMKEESRSLAG